jgi:2-dehydro-3-deoxy-D-gluconate 5-dehydrogenase
MNLFDLTGRKAIVTGAGAGLGKAITEGLHNAGVEVVIIDIRKDISQVASSMCEKGPKIFGVQCDLTDRNDLAKAFDRSISLLGGRLDILINNAGMVIRHPVDEYPMKDWDRIMELNVNSVFLLSQLAVKLMIPQGKGKIINLASMLSFTGGYLVTAYSASKGAIAILTKAMGNELASKGINVNAIAPGYMDTDLNAPLIADPVRSVQILSRIPAGRWGKPEELQGAIIYLASDASNYLSGAIIPIDGGYLSR